jgi:hypothetical protein
MNDLRLILLETIIIVFCLILVSVLFSVLRRVSNNRRYEKVDRLREKFRPVISAIIASGSIDAVLQFNLTSKVLVGSYEMCPVYIQSRSTCRWVICLHVCGKSAHCLMQHMPAQGDHQSIVNR